MDNVKRLIDVMDTVTKISKKVQPLLRIGASTRELYDTILGCLADAPTVDAVEVVHGKWIKGKHPGEYSCSRCGMEYCEADPADKPFNYCPECGSKNE